MSFDITTFVNFVNPTIASILNRENDVTSLTEGGSGVVGNHGDDHVHMEPRQHHMMVEMLATARRMHFAASVVVGPIFAVFGMFGNILSIVVWSRRNMRSSTGRYLTALAVADIGLLICFILTDTVQMIYPELEDSAVYAILFAYLGYPCFFLCFICSIWFMVGVTIDRFIMVYLITKAKEYCSDRRVKFSIGTIGTMCFLINVPHYLSFTVDWDRGANGTGPALVKTEFQKGEAGMAYEIWVHCIVLVLVPWVTVFTLNMLIISKIGKTNRKMSSTKTAQSADKSRQSENQITRLLLIVTFTFLVLLVLQCVTQCFYAIMPEEFDKNIIDEAFAVGKLGAIINSSINFALYCVSGRRFRQEMFKLLGCKGRHPGILSSTDHSSTSASGMTSVGTVGM